jgi:TRAP transporter TAXI family solute receptor
MRRHLAIFGVLLLLSFPLATFGARSLNIATGGIGGVYYPLGIAMARIFTETVQGVQATAQPTAGSITNMDLVSKADAELALIQNDIAYYGFSGSEMFKERKISNVRGLAVLYPESIQIVAPKGAGIRSIRDLKGKRVGVGVGGSGTEANARQILEVYGLSYADLGRADFLGFADVATQLKEGAIDAGFITAGFPTDAIRELAVAREITLLPLEKRELEGLRKRYPFFTPDLIPAWTYRGQEKPVQTVAVQALLVARADLEGTFIYTLLHTLFANHDFLATVHPKGKLIRLETALQGMSIPLHPGAQRFYRDTGLLR